MHFILYLFHSPYELKILLEPPETVAPNLRMMNHIQIPHRVCRVKTPQYVGVY